jgi:hypothetical protein
MDPNSTALLCDGCGLPASPEHIASRVERLELATQFRPIHIHVLFVALEPMPRLEDDFYRPPESRDFFDSFLSALNISDDAATDAKTRHIESQVPDSGVAKVLEFQRRGYYLTYLSECPLTSERSAVTSKCVSRLAPMLIKRIRFNYKPKYVALLGANLNPLIAAFDHARIGPLMLLKQGAPLTIPECALYLERAAKGSGSA